MNILCKFPQSGYNCTLVTIYMTEPVQPYIPEKCKHMSTGKLVHGWTDGHSSSIYYSQKVGTTQISTNWWISKHVAYPCTGMLFGSNE